MDVPIYFSLGNNKKQMRGRVTKGSRNIYGILLNYTKLIITVLSNWMLRVEQSKMILLVAKLSASYTLKNIFCSK